MTSANSTAQRVLVVWHIFYPDQIPWFLDKLGNICDCSWDLVVTHVGLDEKSRQEILRLRPDAKLLQVENIGFDVIPFFIARESVRPEEYDLVLKLHTKGPAGDKNFKYNHRRLKGYDWRNTLVDALLRSPKQWKRNLEIFRKEPRTGMVCSRTLMVSPSPGLLEDTVMLDEELGKYGWTVKDRRFCAGTMFLIRSFLLDALQPLTAERQADVSIRQSGGTPAHLYERLFTLCVRAQGYRVHCRWEGFSYFCTGLIRNQIGSLFRFLFDISRDDFYRKYIQILGFRIYLTS